MRLTYYVKHITHYNFDSVKAVGHKCIWKLTVILQTDFFLNDKGITPYIYEYHLMKVIDI